MNKWLLGGLAALLLINGLVWGAVKLDADRAAHERTLVVEARNLALKEFEAAMTKQLQAQNAEDEKRFAALKASMDKRNIETIAKLSEMQRAQSQKTEDLSKALSDLKDGPLSEQAKEYFKREAQ